MAADSLFEERTVMASLLVYFFKFFYRIFKCLNAFNRQCIIQGSAEAPDGTVSG